MTEKICLISRRIWHGKGIERSWRIYCIADSRSAEVSGARLSHWYGDSKILTIDAGGLRALIRHYSKHDTDLDG